MNTARLRMLEEEMEKVRTRLYQAVAGHPARLDQAGVLPISRRLDRLIVEYQKERNKKQ
ncbi:aspartyl-phosphate phosphatase Spo0E family protein [Mechercharimyces sp. CAU 1602]|uniref:aspartyl-phosphate phosphatase Spo0E family protein n=1 Tax=Mechercharimyces sp. CAU 1602 TaxID=2973933 RepID=UPI0021620485|nr:aspartyl-phosphate phosphatase Spo0E family protein [Mechercharimyces sp. CAU 1602]MCS1351262.1 aspartyl-phosphate phosphatase Spo0E family protein [Mechercharimyces sp. CAU 1602]